jgi:NitT/TauT family transport system substrate-binding protein
VSEVPTPWLCLQEDLRDAGVDPQAIARIPDKLMQENVRALLKGEIDVAQLFEPYVSQAIEQGAGQILHTANARGYTAYTTFISTVDGMQRNRDAFNAMIRAIEQFGPWLAEHGPEELARVVAPFYPDLTQKTLASAMTRYQQAGLWTCRRVISRAGFERLGKSMYHSGYIGREPDYEDCVADIAHE